MAEKLEWELEQLQKFRQRVLSEGHSKVSEVGPVQTKLDGECLGVSYEHDTGPVKVYWHDPSQCFCIEDQRLEPREMSLQHDPC